MSPVSHHPALLSPESIRERLREGFAVRDAQFDHHLEPELQKFSRHHWTPLEVATEVGELVDGLGIESVVDIGSGAGKFCVGAALVSRARFVGVERRAALVDSANRLASKFGVDARVSFLRGSLEEGNVPAASAYYLFNPFGENLFGVEDWIDESVDLGPERYEADLQRMNRFLERAPLGTQFILYNGFGGSMPKGYVEIYSNAELPNELVVWRREM